MSVISPNDPAIYKDDVVTMTCNYDARDNRNLDGFGVYKGEFVAASTNDQNTGCKMVYVGQTGTANPNNPDAELGPTKEQCEAAYADLKEGNAATLQIKVSATQAEKYRCNIWDYRQDPTFFDSFNITKVFSKYILCSPYSYH